MGAGRGRVWGWAGHSLCGSVGHWPNLRLQFIMHCTPCGLDSSNSVSGQIQSTSGSSMSLEPRIFHESQPGRSFSPLLARSISIPPQGPASPLSMVGSSSKLTSWNFVTYELHDRFLQHRTFMAFPAIPEAPDKKTAWACQGGPHEATSRQLVSCPCWRAL